MEVAIIDEFSPLKAVVVGTAKDFGGTPRLDQAYDPKSKEHIKMGTFPKEEDLRPELDGLADTLEGFGITVYRPKNIPGINQIFARDIGFVVENFFIKGNVVADRRREFEGIEYLVQEIDSKKIVQPPQSVRIEGGDVMPWNDKILIGYSKEPDFDSYVVSRTNQAGVDFMRGLFPQKEVLSFELKKSDTNAMENALHLDCCFQPIGNGQAIMYKGGFKNELECESLIKLFGEDNIIFINQQEMYDMFSNIISISPDEIISEKGFTRLNEELIRRGFNVTEINFSETAKMEGLLRCSTLPLRREG